MSKKLYLDKAAVLEFLEDYQKNREESDEVDFESLLEWVDGQIFDFIQDIKDGAYNA